MNSREKCFLRAVVKQYLTSRDFNGYRVDDLEGEELRTFLKPLLEQSFITARYGDLEINPYIRPFKDPPVDIQLKMLQESTLSLVVVYPSERELSKHVKPEMYAGKRFDFEIASGRGQLEYCCFDLSVLEFYRNDPRYYYKADDTFGSI